MIHLIVDGDELPSTLRTFRSISDRYAALSDLVQQDLSLDPLSFDNVEGSAATVARMALNLQRIAGIPVAFSFGQARGKHDGHDLVVEFQHPQVGLLAAQLAIRWSAELLDASPPGFDLLDAFRRFALVVASSDHGIMGRSIAEAARRRGIPQSVVDPAGRVVEFGTGRHRKRMFGASTSLTPSIGAWMSRDKHLTNHYLREAGLPVPQSIAVGSLHQALAAARVVGYPVVVKPLDLGASIGVVLDVRDDEDLRARFGFAEVAAATGTGKMVVERFVAGNDYRALVVNHAVIGISQRLRPMVEGDGVHTVQQLVDIENRNPQRGTRASDVYKQIPIDEQVVANLDRQGLSLNSVPAAGQPIELKASGSRHDGAMYVDVTDAILPENAAVLTTAASVIGLDIAGIDVVAPNLSQPFRESGGAIIEVNDSPGYSLHLLPGIGQPRDPGPAIVDMLFPVGQPVRATVIAIMAHADATAIARSIAVAVSGSCRGVGMASSDSLVIDGMPYTGVQPRNPTGPRTLLNNPNVDLAIVEVDAQSVVDGGLGFDRCDIAIVLSLSGVRTPFGQPVETVLLGALDRDGVAILNAADRDVVALANDLRNRFILSGLEPHDARYPVLLSQGYRAVISPADGRRLDMSGRADSSPEIDDSLPATMLAAQVVSAAVKVLRG